MHIHNRNRQLYKLELYDSLQILTFITNFRMAVLCICGFCIPYSVFWPVVILLFKPIWGFICNLFGIKEAEVKKKPADDDDLFGDDEPAKEAPKPKPQPAAKPKKEKPAAKSMIIFDVKVYEMETDLNELFKKITSEITIDGLVWNNEPKILPIAFGMNKLQVGCVVEDTKVSVDDIYEKIEAWEDLVQSIDTVSFQKL